MVETIKAVINLLKQLATKCLSFIHKILQKIDDRLLKALCEIALNLKAGNIPIDKSKRAELLKSNLIKKLSNKRIGRLVKKNLLKLKRAAVVIKNLAKTTLPYILQSIHG